MGGNVVEGGLSQISARASDLEPVLISDSPRGTRLTIADLRLIHVAIIDLVSGPRGIYRWVAQIL